MAVAILANLRVPVFDRHLNAVMPAGSLGGFRRASAAGRRIRGGHQAVDSSGQVAFATLRAPQSPALGFRAYGGS